MKETKEEQALHNSRERNREMESWGSERYTCCTMQSLRVQKEDIGNGGIL